ncbi:hypothetical protein [Methylibium sp. Root1272]|uniref:hypothetical protein n=1 Tax=Methylibium sp. Root1272 TaxID=1736441 RepID=UPI0006FD0DDB|nr:hypothetical protein [Methylibium sp. Root1272]KQW67933.1 hypothetical protein ASC67_11195 [Methylibium sp. Root1272]
MLDAALLSYLLAAAARLSGYDPVPLEDLPSIQQLPASVIRSQVCPVQPQTCADMIAIFDNTRSRILISDELDPRNGHDSSFIVHEFVHVLEYRRKASQYQADCEETLASERTAYRVQNAYLREQGRPERYGGLLQQMVCTRDQPLGASAMRLEMAPVGSRDEMALEGFMQDLGRQRSTNAPPR